MTTSSSTHVNAETTIRHEGYHTFSVVTLSQGEADAKIFIHDADVARLIAAAYLDAADHLEAMEQAARDAKGGAA